MRFVGIDPSTKTGLVALDESGGLLAAKELTGVGSKDPKRMATLIGEVVAHLFRDDLVCIEGFGYASPQAIQMGGIGWGIRIAMHVRGINYIEAAPSQLKKFASGRGNTKKDELGIHVFKRWDFEHRSDNVRDAYVLAQIMRATHTGTYHTGFQAEVIQAILNPPVKKKKRA